MEESASKALLIEKLTSFYDERINFARQSIVKQSIPLIKEKDVILIFGWSAIVVQILVAAAARNVSFQARISKDNYLRHCFLLLCIPCD